MKKALVLIITLISIATLGQTADAFLQSGIEKHKSKSYALAIDDYSKAIQLDKRMTEAYYNRGVCNLALKEFKSAMNDFDKAIELDPKFIKAYYSRASVFVSQEKYAEALPDLDKTIELESTTPNAYSLRGQIRAQTGNSQGACADFNKAKNNGDPQADKYLRQFCNSLQFENLQLLWPENENWKAAPPQEDSQIKLVELLRNGETFDNWTEIGTLLTYKGAIGQNLEASASMLFDQTKKKCPDAKFTLVEADKSAQNPWIIFSIECPVSGATKTPESQLWYFTQGKAALYAVDRAIKQKSLPNDLKLKWTAFFKTARILSK